MKRIFVLFILPALLITLLVGSAVITSSRAQVSDPYARRFPSVVFANLGTPANGSVRYCTNCQATSPCTSGGAGAIAHRVNGAWNCSTGGEGTALPVADSTSVIKGSADATKLLRLEVDGFTTGTTRVLTPPNYDGTIATLAGTETITNKDLSSATNTFPSLPALTGLTYSGSWADFGSGYQAVGYTKIFGLVFVSGLAISPNPCTNTIGVLPAGYRPAAKERFGVGVGASAGSIDIASDGTISSVGCVAATVYSLSGIVFRQGN